MDTNILNVDMAALGNAAPFATGDPTICSGCRACLSTVSILTGASSNNPPAAAAAAAADTDGKGGVQAKEDGPMRGGAADSAIVDGVYDWTCEFCDTVNRVELDDMEKPVEGQDSVDYVLEPAPVAATAVSSGKAGDGDKVRIQGVRKAAGVKRESAARR